MASPDLRTMSSGTGGTKPSWCALIGSAVFVVPTPVVRRPSACELRIAPESGSRSAKYGLARSFIIASERALVAPFG